MIIKYLFFLFFISINAYINAYTIQFSRKNFIRTSFNTAIPLLLPSNNNANNPIVIIEGENRNLNKYLIKSILNNKNDDIQIISKNLTHNYYNNNKITYKKADINNINNLKNTINDARAVIIPANTTEEQTYNIANVCITYDIPRLLMISNLYNLNNENIIEELYSTKKINKKIIKNSLNPSYTICRAGFLISNKTDNDIAELIVNSIDNHKSYNKIMI